MPKQSITTLFGLFIITILSAQNFDSDGFAIPGSIKGSRFGLGEDSVKCVTNFSLYRENYRQWRASDFQNEAIKYTIDSWRYVFNNCPLASLNTYLDGTKIVEYLYNQTNDEELKNKYIDTLMLIYDQRIMVFGNDQESGEGFILGRKGIEYVSYRPDDFQTAYNIFKRSVEKSGNSSESAVLYYYFLTNVRMVREAGADSMLVFDAHNKASAIIDYNIRQLKNEIKQNPDNGEKLNKQITSYENTMGNIENLFEPFATCQNLVDIFQHKFEETPKDKELLEKIINSLEKKNCTEPLYYKASEALYEVDPTTEAAFALGRMYYRLEEHNKAIFYLQESTKGSTDTTRIADAYLLLSEIYRGQRQFVNSRTNALNAIRYRPNDGRPYILIGDLYAMSASDCGDDEKFSKKTAYWAAVDKYQRARSVDDTESVRNTANSRISTYTAHFPKTNEIFFRNYNKDDSYTVECWINEVTTIRSSD